MTFDRERDVLVCTFVPEAWVNDYAVEADAEGPRMWDVTGLVLSRVRHQIPRIGECLGCGHFLPFAAYQHDPTNVKFFVGICAACHALVQPNRGPCSRERGCACG